jgi:hypothetical protein
MPSSNNVETMFVQHPHAPKYLQTWRYILETKTGTPMGTPPGANYPELYYGTSSFAALQVTMNSCGSL